MAHKSLSSRTSTYYATKVAELQASSVSTETLPNANSGRELEAAASINAALRTTKSLEEMLPRMLDQTLSLIQAEEGSIWLYDAMYDTISLPTHQDGRLDSPYIDSAPPGYPGVSYKKW